MIQTYRFGRRMPLPSTVQILHELLVLTAQENAREKTAADVVSAVAPPNIGQENAKHVDRDDVPALIS